MKYISEIYPYTNENNNIVYETVRFIPKSFRQRRIYGDNYIWGISGGEYRQGKDGDYYRRKLSDPNDNKYIKFPPVSKHYPYHVNQMLHSDYVFLVEGEKDVHSLEQINCVATTNSGGISSFHKQIRQYFHNKSIYILCDNDAAGVKGAHTRASLLHNIAKEIKIIPPFQQLQLHGDITDWLTLDISNNKESLLNIVHSTQNYQYIEEKTSETQRQTKQKKKTSSIYDFLNYFSGILDVGNNSWNAHCPCHKDSVRSLSIAYKTNKILLYCFAGCKTYDILQALNLSWNDLFF